MLLALLLTLNPAGVHLVGDDAPRVERRAALLAEKPKIVAPILMISGGVVSALGGAVLAWVGVFTGIYYAFSFAVGSVVLLTVGLVFVGVAVPLIIAGGVKLHRARLERRRIDQELERLDQDESAMVTVATF